MPTGRCQIDYTATFDSYGEQTGQILQGRTAQTVPLLDYLRVVCEKRGSSLVFVTGVFIYLFIGQSIEKDAI